MAAMRGRPQVVRLLLERGTATPGSLAPFVACCSSQSRMLQMRDARCTSDCCGLGPHWLYAALVLCVFNVVRLRCKQAWPTVAVPINAGRSNAQHGTHMRRNGIRWAALTASLTQQCVVVAKVRQA